MERLKNDLHAALNREVSLGKEMPEPDYALNVKRNQYLSTTIVRRMRKEKAYAEYEKILGVVDHDLYVPELNFVFGEAGRKAAVISLTRLRQEFYGMPEDKHLFYRRALTEAVHEMGHTYGLSHCMNLSCVMFFSNSLLDTDRKGFEFCPRCKDKLLKNF
jgi:archaemetzincin